MGDSDPRVDLSGLHDRSRVLSCDLNGKRVLLVLHFVVRIFSFIIDFRQLHGDFVPFVVWIKYLWVGDKEMKQVSDKSGSSPCWDDAGSSWLD